MTKEEQKLWASEEMLGWRTAFEACVEDDARDDGCKKYLIYDSKEEIVAKGDVRKVVADPV
jgi:hypothetical protein